MKRDPRAFLSDVIEAGQAIQEAIAGISLDEYGNSRLIQLSRTDGGLFAQIDQAPQIISFRNKLTHEYIKISNHLVWGVINNDLPSLVEHCRHVLTRLDRELP